MPFRLKEAFSDEARFWACIQKAVKEVQHVSGKTNRNWRFLDTFVKKEDTFGFFKQADFTVEDLTSLQNTVKAFLFQKWKPFIIWHLFWRNLVIHFFMFT